MRNPSEKSCWVACVSCHRCADKGRWSSCASCSGRHDPQLRFYPDPDDVCSCSQGILRWRTQKGKRIVVPFKDNPFAGKVQSERNTMDESDWQSYLKQGKERYGENWDPVIFEDGTSTDAWFRKYRSGY